MSRIIRKVMPLELLIACGHVQDVAYVGKFGRIVNFDATAAPVDVWAGGGTYPGFVDAASTISLVSTSAADAAAGTGIRTVEVQGLDATGALATEQFTLTGLTPVVSTSTWLRVFRVKGMSAGSGGVNAGVVTVTHVDAAVVLAHILVGVSQTEQAVWTCPTGVNSVVVHRVYSLALATGSTARVATFGYRFRAAGSGCWRSVAPIVVATANPPYSATSQGVVVMSPGDDLTVRVTNAGAANLTATAEFDVYMYPEGG